MADFLLQEGNKAGKMREGLGFLFQVILKGIANTLVGVGRETFL
jgi:hypothetical protein